MGSWSCFEGGAPCPRAEPLLLPPSQVCREDADQWEPGPADPGRAARWTCPADSQQRKDGDWHHAGEGLSTGSDPVTPKCCDFFDPHFSLSHDIWAVSPTPLFSLFLSLSHIGGLMPDSAQSSCLPQSFPGFLPTPIPMGSLVALVCRGRQRLLPSVLPAFHTYSCSKI